MIAYATLILLAASAPTALLVGGDATLASDLAAELEARPWRVVQPAMSVPPPAPHPGQAFYAEGKQAYDELLFEDAVPKLLEAVAQFEGGPLAAPHWDDYLHALLYLALTYDAMGQAEQSDAVLDKLALYALAPDIADAQFPPPFRAKVAARLGIKPVKSGGIRVDSVPEGAEVFLNGQRAGVTPFQRHGLPGATHTVAVRHAGYLPFEKQVRVQAGFGIGAEATPEWVKAALTPLQGPVMTTAVTALRARRLPGAAETQALQAELKIAGATMCFVVVEGPEGLVTAALREDGTWRGPESFAADALAVPPRRAQLVRQLAFWTQSESKPAAAPAVVEAPQSESPSRWWLWTGLGVLAAGGATAAVIAAQTTERPAPSTGEVVIGW